jgi:hypothetical protein
MLSSRLSRSIVAAPFGGLNSYLCIQSELFDDEAATHQESQSIGQVLIVNLDSQSREPT